MINVFTGMQDTHNRYRIQNEGSAERAKNTTQDTGSRRRFMTGGAGAPEFERHITPDFGGTSVYVANKMFTLLTSGARETYGIRVCNANKTLTMQTRMFTLLTAHALFLNSN